MDNETILKAACIVAAGQIHSQLIQTGTFDVSKRAQVVDTAVGLYEEFKRKEGAAP